MSELPAETVLPAGTSGWVVRPKLTRRMRLGVAVIAAILVVIALTDVGRPRAAMVNLISFGPLAVAGVIVLVVYLRVSRLTIDRDSITRVTSFGRSRTWPLTEVARADRFITINRTTTRYLVFVGTTGRALIVVNDAFWDLDAVIAICRHLRIHLTGSFTDVESGLRLNRRIPGVTTWRSWVAGIALVGAIVVLASIATLTYGPSSTP